MYKCELFVVLFYICQLYNLDNHLNSSIYFFSTTVQYFNKLSAYYFINWRKNEVWGELPIVWRGGAKFVTLTDIGSVSTT